MKSFVSSTGIEYQQPENVDDIKHLVNLARTQNRGIIIHGARHSFPLSHQPPDKNVIYVKLTYLNKIVSSDWQTGKFTVQAGCHIGEDPMDETKVSTWENSLVYQLDPVNKDGRRTVPPGWALPELGGITHQTLGGFMATGSSGGSARFGFHEAIESVRLIYYSADKVEDKTFRRPADNNPNDPFWAVGYANLDLLGIIAEVTIQCVGAYNIAGKEITSQPAVNSSNFLNENAAFKSNFKGLFDNDDYSRLLWWPQRGINKLMVWTANRQLITDWEKYRPKPYKSLPIINGSSLLANKIFGAIFYFTGNFLVRLKAFVIRHFGQTDDQVAKIKAWFLRLDIWILRIVLSVFAKNGKQRFDDAWWRALPMDDQVSDEFSPVKFTELWIPLHRSNEVLTSLETFYNDPENAGNFCSEFYAARGNNFWLSPAYGNDMIRVDVFWFGRNAGDPILYFERFWRFLAHFGFRYHWGKYLAFINPDETKNFVQGVYPKWKDFMKLRKDLDPYNIFLTKYWKDNLGIE